MGFTKFNTSEKTTVIKGEEKNILSRVLTKFGKTKASDLTKVEQQELREELDGNLR